MTFSLPSAYTTLPSRASAVSANGESGVPHEEQYSLPKGKDLPHMGQFINFISFSPHSAHF
jgi:hypothetical protein